MKFIRRNDSMKSNTIKYHSHRYYYSFQPPESSAVAERPRDASCHWIFR